MQTILLLIMKNPCRVGLSLFSALFILSERGFANVSDSCESTFTNALPIRSKKPSIADLNLFYYNDGFSRTLPIQVFNFSNHAKKLSLVSERLTTLGVEYSWQKKFSISLRKNSYIQITPGESTYLNRLAKKLWKNFGTKVVYNPKLLSKGTVALYHEIENSIYISHQTAYNGKPDSSFFHEAKHAAMTVKKNKKRTPMINGAMAEILALVPFLGIKSNDGYQNYVDFQELATWKQDYLYSLKSLRSLLNLESIRARDVKHYLDSLEIRSIDVFAQLLSLILAEHKRLKDGFVISSFKEKTGVLSFYSINLRLQVIAHEIPFDFIESQFNQEFNFDIPNQPLEQKLKTLKAKFDSIDGETLQEKIIEQYLIWLGSKAMTAIKEAKETEKRSILARVDLDFVLSDKNQEPNELQRRLRNLLLDFFQPTSKTLSDLSHDLLNRWQATDANSSLTQLLKKVPARVNNRMYTVQLFWPSKSGEYWIGKVINELERLDTKTRIGEVEVRFHLDGEEKTLSLLWRGNDFSVDLIQSLKYIEAVAKKITAVKIKSLPTLESLGKQRSLRDSDIKTLHRLLSISTHQVEILNFSRVLKGLQGEKDWL